MNRPLSAVVMSVAVHAMLLSSFGTLTAAKPETPVIRVSLRHIPKPEPIPIPEPPAPQSPQPVTVPAAVPSPAPVPDPVPAPEPKPAPEPVKQPEKPVPPKPKPKPAPPKPKQEQPKPKPSPVKENSAKPNIPQAETIPSVASAQAETSKLPASGGAARGAVSPGNVTGHAVVDVSSLTVTKKVPPVYPMISRKRKEQGTVTLLVTIASGAVKSVEIEHSSGHSPLDESAMQAVKGWKFEIPGATSVVARIPFVFTLR